jgi:hypothetical protein
MSPYYRLHSHIRRAQKSPGIKVAPRILIKRAVLKITMAVAVQRFEGKI